MRFRLSTACIFLMLIALVTVAAADRNTRSISRESHEPASNNMLFISKALLDWYMWLKDILGNFDLGDIIEQVRSLGGAAMVAVFTEFNFKNILAMFRKILVDRRKMIMMAIVNFGIILFINPEVIWIPVLKSLGFDLLGPVAGSFAAFIQGPFTPAKSWFAVAQSAGMGGYGSLNINMIARLGGLKLTALGIFQLTDPWNWFSKVAPDMSPADFAQFYSELVDYWPMEL